MFNIRTEEATRLFEFVLSMLNDHQVEVSKFILLHNLVMFAPLSLGFSFLSRFSQFLIISAGARVSQRYIVITNKGDRWNKGPNEVH